jgi:hypothetical protein
LLASKNAANTGSKQSGRSWYDVEILGFPIEDTLPTLTPDLPCIHSSSEPYETTFAIHGLAFHSPIFISSTSVYTTLTSTLQNPRSHPLYAAGRLEEISGGSREADASIESYIRNRGIHWCRRTVEHAPTSTGPPVQVCGGLAYTASIRAFGWTHHAMIGIQTMDLP